MTKRLACCLLLALAAPAFAVPPPVPVGVSIVDLRPEATRWASAEQAVAILVESGFIATGDAPVAAERLHGCDSEPDRLVSCIASLLTAGGAGHQVAMVVDHPQWRSAAFRVRCIGPDALRATEARVHLRDLSSPHAAVANGERAGLSACLIGALHGPRHAAAIEGP